MTPEQFCYWLQGRAELQPDTPLSPDEWKAVVDHLALVFKKQSLSMLPADASRQRPLQAAALQQSFGRMVNDDLPQC